MIKLYVKHMVSLRCKMMVMSELKKLGLRYSTVELGMAEVFEDIKPEQREQLKINLKRSGLELMDDKDSTLVENIKSTIIDIIQDEAEITGHNYSEYISKKLGYDYAYLANTFAEVNGITIQQFTIINKIEHAKSLIVYDNLSISEIAYKLNYSSAAHLSNQFKKVTGLTPSFFRKTKNLRNNNLIYA